VSVADKLRSFERWQDAKATAVTVAVLPEIAAVIEAAEQVREHDTPALVRDIQEAEAMWASLDEMYKALAALARRLEQT